MTCVYWAVDFLNFSLIFIITASVHVAICARLDILINYISRFWSKFARLPHRTQWYIMFFGQLFIIVHSISIHPTVSILRDTVMHFCYVICTPLTSIFNYRKRKLVIPLIPFHLFTHNTQTVLHRSIVSLYNDSVLITTTINHFLSTYCDNHQPVLEHLLRQSSTIP